ILAHSFDKFGNLRYLTVELHLGDRVLSGAADFHASCASHLQPSIPRGLQVRVVRWKYDLLHNRYLLTDRGAIQFGEGLDAAGSSGRQDDTLSLLSEADAQLLIA